MDELNKESHKGNAVSSNAKKWFVGSLTLANFSTNTMDFLMSIFLVDIAIVFLGSATSSNVSLVSQLITISNIVSLIVGLLLGTLCLRLKHKTLLIAGLLCITIGSIGTSLATDLLTLQIFYPLDGVGTVLIGSMAYTLAAEHLPIAKRGKAVGIIIAGSPVSGLVGSFVISLFFGEVAGWRSFMIFYVFPISIIAIILVYFSIPNSSNPAKAANAECIKMKLSDIFTSRKIVACLIGNLFRYVGLAWGIFGIALARTRFELTTASGSAIALIGNIGLILGMILAGQIVNRIGRKRLVTVSTFCLGFIFLAYASVGNLWLAALIWMTSGIVGGLSFSSDINFTLEQSPRSRGTLMSVNSAFVYLGVAIGAAVGGIVLYYFNYQVVGFVFATFIFVASAIFLTLTEEPCKNRKH